MIGVADGSPMDPWDRYLGLPDAEPADRATAWARALGRTPPAVRTVTESWFELPRARELLGPARLGHQGSVPEVSRPLLPPSPWSS